MSKHLCNELQKLRKHLLTMGGMVEEAVQKSVAGLLERKPEIAREVVSGDDRIDRAEVEVEEECLKVLALHQPVAEDLRFAAAVMKINNDLERVGDLAVNVAERAQFLATQPPIAIPVQLRAMADAASRMVRESLDAFVNRDVEAARRICGEDDQVDEYNREIIATLRRAMQSDPETIERALHLFSVSKYLERIADHATNVAEDVVYLVEGEIIRHRYHHTR
ncbi:MAG: phosphate signaling complex protein PhoU [Planctomycetes bacterium]|nr:phosphate signaling complex protein PhoU [Planctomycetota bacterium]MBI3843641.1 phosphate signaling complex protein PhoU [Planctomycetota bacterium]